jgi:RluA family pseudouridine synthase
MPAASFRLRTRAEHQGLRLDHLLRGWLPDALGRELTHSAIRRLIMAGAVRVDGRPLRAPGRNLSSGLDISVTVRSELLTSPDRPPDRITVLLEDEVLLAVDKPPGLAMHATADPRRPSLVGLLEAKTGLRLGVHQRLDRDTSGVVLFTKARTADPDLATQFAGREVEKVYRALTVRPRALPHREWRSESRLAPGGKGRMGSAPQGVLAATQFRIERVLERGLLVEARPLTGRKHQIRVHLAEAGLPIVGDLTYGAPRDSPAERPMLHAARLALRHPLSGAPLVIESPLPSDFRAALSRLGGEAGKLRR